MQNFKTWKIKWSDRTREAGNDFSAGNTQTVYNWDLLQDFPVPEEYLMSHLIGDRVRPINIRQVWCIAISMKRYSSLKMMRLQVENIEAGPCPD
jgi:hypothetical protein